MDIQSIIQIGTGIVVTVVTTVIYVIKIHKSKNRNEKLSTINKYAQIIQKIPSMITEAEQSVGAGNGTLKKTLVLQNIQLQCAEKGIEYKNDEFTQEIEKILETPQKKEPQCSNANNNSSTQ